MATGTVVLGLLPSTQLVPTVCPVSPLVPPVNASLPAVLYDQVSNLDSSPAGVTTSLLSLAAVGPFWRFPVIVCLISVIRYICVAVRLLGWFGPEDPIWSLPVSV